MQENLKEAFLKAKYVPGVDLADHIWQILIRRSKRIAYLKLTTLSIIGFVSLVSLVPVSRVLIADLSRSGFYEYLSLGFSNSELFFNYWKDFLLLLAETLPAINIIMTLTLIFIFLLSLKYIVRQTIKSARPLGRGQLSLSF
jgi:hypothetical protein